MASTGAVLLPVEPATSAPVKRLALLGNPNTGKTTLFNALCGTRAKTSNFPGTTTAMRAGRLMLEPGAAVDVVDLPGIYDLHGRAPESRVVAGVLEAEGRD